ncbi:MAG: benzoate-CoA ligase family protein [Arenicellales bacterium]|nr:benzoate-CoA ligase family protein [Arenicellales bacterium]MDP6552241.1 benzoate-CoA ligase family protein [Arenicellales bacterium]MDP6790522.1 benzoate-CoA ligase family protein [Arenicellales bacterium]MDP6917760.1 benzoate-CoA ligase family protein [Arenicellales bacterium]
MSIFRKVQVLPVVTVIQALLTGGAAPAHGQVFLSDSTMIHRGGLFARINVAADPPQIEVPRLYNAALEFIDRNVVEGRGEQIALIDDSGCYTYRELCQRVNQAGHVLREAGAGMEQRVLLCLDSGIDLASLFWGAVKIGAVPVPVNPSLAQDDYAGLISDSRPRVLAADPERIRHFESTLYQQSLPCRLLTVDAGRCGAGDLARLMATAPVELKAAATTADDTAFWLYTSGSTGSPKAVVHLHRSLIQTAVLFGQKVLGIGPSDRVFSAAKMFFAYGLGNSMSFPFAVGATSIVSAGRPTAQNVLTVIDQHRPTVFCGVPTLYHNLLNIVGVGEAELLATLRLYVSAGEPLPESIGQRWQALSGRELIDGLGTTEMLQTFLSNRPGQVRYGTTGVAVPGYQIRLVNHTGTAVTPGEVGELMVAGPSAGAGYWNRRAQSIRTFVGSWTRTGDQFFVGPDHAYRYCGRSDDMLKVGGIWVSPYELESLLIRHPLVAECAVVGQPDAGGLIKPKAFVVLKDSTLAGDVAVDTLQRFAREHLAPYKYPRWIEFLDELPRTATGKVRRYWLREQLGL